MVHASEADDRGEASEDCGQHQCNFWCGSERDDLEDGCHRDGAKGLAGQPRSASAVAAEDCRLLALDRGARERMQRERPALASLLDQQVVLGLAGNLARTNSLLRLQR